MRSDLIFVVLVPVALCGLWAGCGNTPSPDTEVPEVVRREIVRAVDAVQGTLGMMQDGGGYQRWTPTTAVEKLVPLLNSALEPMPGEPDVPGVAGKLRYVKGKATGPWQVVLIPDEEKGVIRVEGYGRDTSKPVYTREFKVSEWG